ncbi:MAG: flavodoxin domain-containing protein [Acidobacteriota bacterium]
MTKRILAAYATREGQTMRIVGRLAAHLAAAGHTVEAINLGKYPAGGDPTSFDAVIVAGSVHAGEHEEEVCRYVTDHRDALSQRPTAFLSVSLSAAAGAESGRQRATEQIEAFLAETSWAPDMVEAIAGAFRTSAFSRPWRWMLKLVNRMARKDLLREGWPELTGDREYTDWAALERFGDAFLDHIDQGRLARSA